MQNPYRVAVKSEKSEFNIDNVELTFYYGFTNSSSFREEIWEYTDLRFAAGVYFEESEKFSELYNQRYPQREKSRFAFLDELSVGVHENAIDVKKRFTYDEYNDMEYTYFYNQNQTLVFRHKEKFRISNELFSAECGFLFFFVFGKLYFIHKRKILKRTERM